MASAETGSTETRRVAVLAYDHVAAFDLGVPSQVFSSATDADDRPLYDVITVTPKGLPVVTSAGFTVSGTSDLSAIRHAHTVVVPGPHRGPALETGSIDPDLATALIDFVEHGGRVMSICTGAFVLAAAGLLNGRKATTHWRFADRFRTIFPLVSLHPDVLFTEDAPVFTSAGAAAGIDLCLHLVRMDAGSRIANRAARRCVVPAWRSGGQAQYIEKPVPDARDVSDTAAARAWLLDNLSEPISVATLAARVHMSERHFTRRFREETGLSVVSWITEQRLARARELLEETGLSIEEIARRSGLGSTANLRTRMSAALGTTPAAYRRAFRVK
jgi:transcriptional regulator GlxA family with amidase domain